MNGHGWDIFTSFVLPPLSALSWRMVFVGLGLGRFYSWMLGWFSAAMAILIGSCIQFDLIGIIGGSLNMAAALAVWLWKRKRRKRAPRAYGAKSRALVAALVRRAREAAKPRPVLRPLPGGAR